MFILFFLTIWDDIKPDRVKIIGSSVNEIPLTNMNIKADVFGSSASLNFQLKYKNMKKDTLVEARFVFPMESDMAVSDAVLTYDDKVFISEAMNKTKAREIYEEQKIEKLIQMLKGRRDGKQFIKKNL